MALPARRHVNMHVQLSILHFLIKPVADSYSLNVMAKCYDSTLTLFLGHPRLKINSHDQQEVIKFGAPPIIKCEAPPIIKCEAPPINILAGDQYKQNTSYPVHSSFNVAVVANKFPLAFYSNHWSHRHWLEWSPSCYYIVWVQLLPLLQGNSTSSC